MLKIKKQLIAYRNNEGSFVDSTMSTIIISEIHSHQWCEVFGVKTLELQNIVMKVFDPNNSMWIYLSNASGQHLIYPQVLKGKII
jgi:hypothetical protein